MRDLWSEERKFSIWLEIEILACEALADIGAIPEEDAETIRAKAKFSIPEINEIEKRTQHDVIAFLENVATSVGPAARWMHQGLTSSDVLDTTLAVQMASSCDLLLADLKLLRQTVAERALAFKDTPMIGRSHGIHAEPISFGLKLALMYDEFGRAEERLRQTRERVAVGKLSGAVGTHAHLDPRVEQQVCERLGIKAAISEHADRPTGPARGIFHDARAHRFEHRPLGHRVPASPAHGGAGGGGVFRRGPERQLRDAAQAQSHHRRAPERPGARAARQRGGGPGKRGVSGTSATSAIPASSASSCRTPARCSITCSINCADLVGGLIVYPEHMLRNLQIDQRVVPQPDDSAGAYPARPGAQNRLRGRPTRGDENMARREAPRRQPARRTGGGRRAHRRGNRRSMLAGTPPAPRR